MLGDRCQDILVTGLAPLATQLLQWNMQTVIKFSSYVWDLVTFCAGPQEVGQGLLEIAVKDTYGDGGADGG